MSDRTTHVSPVEGKGFYNRHATVQVGGGALALPLLEQAARLVDVGRGDRPLVVADYGCAQGKISLVPVRTAIGILRVRTSPQRMRQAWLQLRRPSASAEKDTMLKPGHVDIIDPQIRPVERSLNRL